MKLKIKIRPRDQRDRFTENWQPMDILEEMGSHGKQKQEIKILLKVLRIAYYGR